MPLQAPRRARLCRALALWLLLLPALPAPPAVAGIAGEWRVERSAVRYKVRHVLHDATGASAKVSGHLRCRADACRFVFTVPVASFRSGDADRDAQMRRTLRAGRFPYVRVEGRGVLRGGDTAVVDATVHIAGRSVALQGLRFTVDEGWWSFRVAGAFPLSLQACGLERPALLGIPIADEVTLEVELAFTGAG